MQYGKIQVNRSCFTNGESLHDGMNYNKEICYFRDIIYGMIEPIIKNGVNTFEQAIRLSNAESLVDIL